MSRSIFHAAACVLAVGAVAACDGPREPAAPDSPDVAPTELRALVAPTTVDTVDDAVLRSLGDARVVLLGEPTHGTDEVYRARAEISMRLITDRGFDALAFEADFHAMERVDRYVRGLGSDRTAAEALAAFDRFPRWMWRNQAFAELVEAVKRHNAGRPADQQVRMFGIDLQAPRESAAAVVAFLARHDDGAAAAARESYRCLARAVELGIEPADTSCAEAVARPLAAVQALADKPGSFGAIQNALVAQRGEEYFRLAQHGGNAGWNHRDRHMLAILAAIEEHLAVTRGSVQQVVWAHNSHVGDARATEMGEGGQLDVGQLAREHWRGGAMLVGFTTYGGTVMAADNWDEPGRVFEIKPARSDSVEGVFHTVAVPAFTLDTRRAGVAEALPPLLERAIGVVYRPATELQSHYFKADVERQFDLVVHFDITRAVTPLPAP